MGSAASLSAELFGEMKDEYERLKATGISDEELFEAMKAFHEARTLKAAEEAAAASEAAATEAAAAEAAAAAPAEEEAAPAAAPTEEETKPAEDAAPAEAEAPAAEA
jgi:hypothetical protein